MLFGKGNWSIFGIEPGSLTKFKESADNIDILFNLSQLKASITTKFLNKPTVGINPFDGPRLDETLTDTNIIAEIAQTLDKPVTEALNNLETFFGSSESTFRIGQDALSDYYGFWVVFNDFEDVTDLASKKEQLSYTAISRPYKFLLKGQKKSIDSHVQATNVLTRRQFPVLLDFVTGRVFAATTVADEIDLLRSILKDLGAECFSLRWDFDSVDFPKQFLNLVVRTTKPEYKEAIKSRAEELTRFSKEEVEKLEDKAMEKVVNNFFAIAEIETEQWAALKGPSRIILHKNGEPVTVAGPSGAFSLLELSESTEVESASVVFQDLLTRVRKGVEYKIRKDLFSISMDKNINNQDVGVALLKGFDLPSYRQGIAKEIRENKTEIPISKYWSKWLIEMNGAVVAFIENLSVALDHEDVNKDERKTWGLSRFESETSKEIILPTALDQAENSLGKNHE